MIQIDVRKPEALWFGRTRATCFGMLHQPEASIHQQAGNGQSGARYSGDGTRGVVFCNALGFDGLLAHRAFGHLAENMTARGFWALRFDYDGEGDSTGGSWEPGRIDAWTASVDAAVGVLRARGVTDVRLVGFRTGASLAYRYATTHPGISGLVLWSPCVSGSSYVRELRALSRLSAAARPIQRVTADRFPADSLEVVGFEFSAEVQRDLAELDLVTSPVTVAVPSVLVIDRVDAPPSEDLVNQLVDSGSKVDHERMAGYTEFITEDEVTSVIPEPILQRIEDWLDAAEPPDVEPGTRDAGVVELSQLTIGDPTAGRFAPAGPARDSVIEEPVWVNGRLFAIVSTPAGRAPARRVSIVLSNTGSTNRVGPGRLYVSLARYWASLGFTVVRVDLGGTGDSLAVDPATENDPYAPVRLDEVRETVNWIRRRTGFDSAVLFGLCSGAYNGFHSAINGVAVKHVMLVNPGVFYLGADHRLETSTEAQLMSAHSLSRGLVNVRKWRMVFKEPEILSRGFKRARDLLAQGATNGLRAVVAAWSRNTARRVGLHVKAPTGLPRDLETITTSGIKIQLVFAAGESALPYARVFGGRAFDELVKTDGLELVEIDGGDHVFSPPGARQRLFEESTRYLEREYPLCPEDSASSRSDRVRNTKVG